MRRRITLLTLLLGISFFGTSQDFDMEETCEQAESRASNDFENDKMQITSYGLIISTDYYFEEFYSKYLLEKYQVEYGNGGCIIWDALMCYEDKMLKLVESKYGENFLKRTRKEALKEYKPYRTQIIEEYHKDTEGGYIYADTMPEYPGGFPELLDFVDSEMEKAGISEYKGAGKFFIQLVVEPDGSINSLKSVRTTNEEIETALINILRSAPKWKPGILNGSPVKVQLVLPFYNE
ncbi:MAG: energy transducer TonB [Cyclobacteriaceae bacterium]